MTDRNLLEVRNLSVSYTGASRPVFSNLDLDVSAGRCLAVVGPSGCGKSTLCKAILDLLPGGAAVNGSIRWRGDELTRDRTFWHGLRGTGIGLLLQDHRYALDPVRRIGDQVSEVLRLHRPELTGSRIRHVTHELLSEMQLPQPSIMARLYPHQLSGGQRQRACLAAALAAGPQLLLADEPTTALDLLVQRGIIGLLRDLVDGRGLGLLLVTHDHELVQLIADRTFVWPGQTAVHAPSAHAPGVRPSIRTVDPLPCLRVRDLSVAVSAAGGSRRVVRNITLSLYPGRTLGLAGESGAGKTTLARALAGWHPALTGTIDLDSPRRISRGERLRAVQMVSQDAVAALNPRQRVLAAISEAARAAGDTKEQARLTARSLMGDVDLSSDLERRPTMTLSGGQRQRVQLARALAARPRVLIADEPASSLDAVRRQALVRLLRRLQDSHGLALLVISHDLSWLEAWCDQVAVMLEGYLVELYTPGTMNRPMHPFARDLAASACRCLRRDALMADPRTIPRDPSTAPRSQGSCLSEDPEGCPYARRCYLVQPSCHRILPPLATRDGGHLLRCPPADRHAT